MADEIFQDGVHGESLWINSTKNIFSLSSSTNCAFSLLDPIIGQHFTWPINDQFLDMKNSRSNNNDDYYSSSDDSMVFQELSRNHNLSSMDYDSNNLQILGVNGNSSSPPDWNQSLNDSILQENLNSSQNYPHHDDDLKRNFSSIISEDNSLIKPIMNQDFTNYYSDLLQTLFDNTNPHQDQQSFNYVSSSSTNKKTQNLNDFAPSKCNIEKVEESTYKRSRIETPSPLPTFKVRKEKLGDRITALQQLVSPFGKTDTASVLQEAIEYINFLHDQVLNVLKTSCIKNGSTTQHQQVKEQEGLLRQDLRSKGLCLVPISSIFPVAAETTMDFWTPTLGRTFT